MGRIYIARINFEGKMDVRNNALLPYLHIIRFVYLQYWHSWLFPSRNWATGTAGCRKKSTPLERSGHCKEGIHYRIAPKDNYYYDENLTLNKLSDQLEIPLKELSYIINTGFNMNFNDFINDFRIKAFKERLKDPQNDKYNFIGLAYEVGFNSKASFYRAFKKSTNQTPGEYYKNNIIK